MGCDIMDWFDLLKKDKKDMRVGRVYPSDREGKKIMMLTHEGKKIHAGARALVIINVKLKIVAAELIEVVNVEPILEQGITATNVKVKSQLLNV